LTQYEVYQKEKKRELVDLTLEAVWGLPKIDITLEQYPFLILGTSELITFQIHNPIKILIHNPSNILIHNPLKIWVHNSSKILTHNYRKIQIDNTHVT